MEVKTTISLTEREKKQLVTEIISLMRKTYHPAFRLDQWSPDVHMTLRTLALKLAGQEDEYCQ